MLCQAYDSDPSNPAVLNLLAHNCLTRKEYGKVGHMQQNQSSFLSSHPGAEHKLLGWRMLTAIPAVGQAIGTEGTPVCKQSRGQGSLPSQLGQGMSRIWGDPRRLEGLHSGVYWLCLTARLFCGDAADYYILLASLLCWLRRHSVIGDRIVIMRNVCRHMHWTRA